MRRLIATLTAVALLCACSSTPSVRFIEGGGAARVVLEVDGQEVSAELEALAVGDGEFCPVLVVAGLGAQWRGTHPGAPEVCRARHGVLGISPSSGRIDWSSVVDWAAQIMAPLL